MNINEAIKLLRRGLDISIVGKKIFLSNQINYNEGYKIPAYIIQNYTNNEIKEYIKNIKYR